jgi:hypothetical protein
MAHAQVFDRIPTKITAGTSVSWAVSLADFPATEGWTLTYTLVSSGEQLQAVSAPDGAAHLFEIPYTTTYDWPAGTYAWQAHVARDAERYLIASGSVEIVADYAEASDGLDTRTWLDTAISALQASISGRASKTQLSQAVSGVQIQHMTLGEQQNALDRLLDKRRAQRGKWLKTVKSRFKN